MSFVNFRRCGNTDRSLMQRSNAPALRKLEDAEIKSSGGIWFRDSDFPGCDIDAPREKPGGKGQIFRF